MVPSIIKAVAGPKHECRSEEVKRIIEWISSIHARLNIARMADERALRPVPEPLRERSVHHE